jgi:hypothetical protein
MTRDDRLPGEPVGQAPTGFCSPSAYETAEVHQPGLPTTRFVPLSAFLTPSGGCSLRRRAGLFHPAAAPGFFAYRALIRPEIRYLFRGPILPCRCRTTHRCCARGRSVGGRTDDRRRPGGRRPPPKRRHDRTSGARLRRVIPSGQLSFTSDPKAARSGYALLTLLCPLKRSPPLSGPRLPGASRRDLSSNTARRQRPERAFTVLRSRGTARPRRVRQLLWTSRPCASDRAWRPRPAGSAIDAPKHEGRKPGQP